MKKRDIIQKVFFGICLLVATTIFGKDKKGSLENTINGGSVLIYQTTPPPPTIHSQTCNSVTIQNSGTIPLGEMWYWQGTVKKGTSTIYPATSNYTVTASGVYYLRPRNLSTGVWGQGSAIIVTVGSAGAPSWYADTDGDGLGDPASSLVQCTQPSGYVSNSDDQCPTQNGNGSSTGCPNTQSLSDYNYVYSISAQTPTTDIENTLLNDRDNLIESVVYYDGLGRPMQSVAIRQSPNKKDIVSHIHYDAYGRQNKEYLPYASQDNDGYYKLNALGETEVFYNTTKYQNTTNPFMERTLESSPLSRVFEQTAPGLDWKKGDNMIPGKNYSDGQSIKFEYGVNTGPEEISIVNHSFNNSEQQLWNPIGNTYLSSGMLVIFNGNSSGGCELPVSLTGGSTIKISYNITNITGSILDIRIMYDGGSMLLSSAPNDGMNTHEVTLPATVNNAKIRFYIPYTTSDHLVLSYLDIREEDQNFASTDVVKFRGDATWDATNEIFDTQLTKDAVYIKGDLVKIVTKDENWTPAKGKNNTSEEFKNKKGQVVLKRTYADVDANNNGVIDSGEEEIPHETYYVYDVYGNLTYVIPPKVDVSDGVSVDELNNLCYQYKYDQWKRLVEKKIPGKGWEYIIYNKLDQPIMTQDALQRAQNKWLFTKYDPLGRVAYTGIFSHATTGRAFWQDYANQYSYTDELRINPGVVRRGTLIYYTSRAFPQDYSQIITINYYDDYVFDLNGGTAPSSVYNVTPTTDVKGLSTGTKVRVLDSSPEKWITTVTYYDEKAQPIYTYSKNDFLRTTDIVSNKLHFTGRVEETTSTHVNLNDTGNGTHTLVDAFTYDHNGRLLTQTNNINGGINSEVIVNNLYDELGQLESKGVGGLTTANRLQTIDYTYNIRGWLTNINNDANNDNDLFNFSLKYNDIADTSKKLFNGNISETSWNTLNADSSTKTYTYTYDALNRITSGTANNSNYNLTSVRYDKNGNILNLIRRGHTNAAATTFDVMDDLSYTYDTNSNQLLKVADAAIIDGFGFVDDAVNTATDFTDDYTYDVNGNMKTDTNKGITNIEYNHLNLPTKIVFNNNDPLYSQNPQAIQYVYDAFGTKLKKTVVNGLMNLTTTDYSGNFVYEDNKLQFFGHTEGYVRHSNSNGYEYVYQYKDHLGNIRLSYMDKNKDGDIDVTSDPNTHEILEENNYYPFGLRHKGYNENYIPGGNHIAQKYKYNGVEYNESIGLNLYEMDVRMYDPAISRWTTMDPVVHFKYSPYQSFDNNPIFFADPRGSNSEAPEVTLKQLFNMSSNGAIWVNRGNGLFSLAGDEDQETDPRKILKESIKKAKKAKKTIGKFKKVYKALDGLYEIGSAATPQERTKALKQVYNSVTSFLPRNLSFKVFAQYYDTYLALINYQMGIIIKGLQQRNKIFAEIGKQGNVDVGVVYPGAFYGGRELYNYLKTLKHGGKEIKALPNQALKFLRHYAGLLNFVTDSPVPYSLTGLDSTQFWVLQRFGKSRINKIRGEATMYVIDNLDAIINIIYGGLKIQKD